MILCPLEGNVLFNTCPVNTCMWNNKKGSCTASYAKDSQTKDLEDCTPDELEGVQRVKDFVTVGVFLEASTGKELTAIKNNEFPPQEVFIKWAKAKGAKRVKNVPYEDIVESIKANL